MIQVTSGAALGKIAWPMKRIAAQNLNVSTWYNAGETNPALNDGIQLLQLPSVRAFLVQPRGGTVNITNILLDTVGTDWSTGTTLIPGTIRSDSTNLTFLTCSFTRPIQKSPGTVAYTNCQFMGDASWTGSSYSSFTAGGFIGRLFTSNTWQVLFDRGAQASFTGGTYSQRNEVAGAPGSMLDALDMCVFDAIGPASAGLSVRTGSSMIVTVPYGNGQTYGAATDKTSWIGCVGTAQKITGGTNDISLSSGASFIAWASARPSKTLLLDGPTDSVSFSV
jgi:hypothetical protein